MLGLFYLGIFIYSSKNNEFTDVASMFSILGGASTILAAYFAISTFTDWKKIQKHSEKVEICKEISLDLYQLMSVLMKMTEYVLTLNKDENKWRENQCRIEFLKANLKQPDGRSVKEKLDEISMLERQIKIRALQTSRNMNVGINEHIFSEYIHLSTTIEGKIEYLKSIGMRDTDVQLMLNIFGTLSYIGDAIISGKFEYLPNIKSIIAYIPYVDLHSDGINWLALQPPAHAKTHDQYFKIILIDWRLYDCLKSNLKEARKNLLNTIDTMG